jgi:mRNA interferase RelE/StbE
MTSAARKELKRLDVTVQRRVMRKILSLESQPRPPGTKKVEGEDPQYRIRVGGYRIIYEIYDRELVVLVIRVAHRSGAYRR